MITLETQVPLFVGTDAGERYVSTAGKWSFESLDYITLGGTNSPVSITNLNDGALVIVDGGGLVSVILGPDVGFMAINGFTVAIMSLGIMMGIRWVFRRMAAAAQVPGRAVD